MISIGGSAGKKARKARRRAAAWLGRGRTLLKGAEELYQPFQEIGTEASAGLRKLLADPSYITQRGSYKARLAAGRQTIESGAAAKGSLFSGRSLKELTRFGQEFASEEIDKEYARLMGGVGIGMAGVQGVAGLRKAQAGTYSAMAGVTSQLTQTQISAGSALTGTLISAGLGFLGGGGKG